MLERTDLFLDFLNRRVGATPRDALDYEVGIKLTYDYAQEIGEERFMREAAAGIRELRLKAGQPGQKRLMIDAIRSILDAVGFSENAKIIRMGVIIALRAMNPLLKTETVPRNRALSFSEAHRRDELTEQYKAVEEAAYLIHTLEPAATRAHLAKAAKFWNQAIENLYNVCTTSAVATVQRRAETAARTGQGAVPQFVFEKLADLDRRARKTLSDSQGGMTEDELGEPDATDVRKRPAAGS